jgi:hypothetical protein
VVSEGWKINVWKDLDVCLNKKKRHLIKEKCSGEKNLLFELASLLGINAHDQIK